MSEKLVAIKNIYNAKMKLDSESFLENLLASQNIAIELNPSSQETNLFCMQNLSEDRMNCFVQQSLGIFDAFSTFFYKTHEA